MWWTVAHKACAPRPTAQKEGALVTGKMVLIDPLTETLSLPAWHVVDLDFDSLSDSVHSLIDCNCYSAVDVTIYGLPFVLLVDDVGLLKPDWTPNVPAWYWYSQFNEEYPIAGKVLVCKDSCFDGEIDLCGLEDKDLQLLEHELLRLKRLTNS